MSGPLPAAAAPLALPASWIYGAVVTARNRRFDRGRGVARIDRPVISVGNLTAGGTGKTPMVMWIVETLRGDGHRPVIVTRGYTRDAAGFADEVAEYRDRFPDVPVLVDPDRVTALRSFLPAHPQIDCVVMDDGFQHRRLGRDLDLVLVDATRDTPNDRLLPAGWLREPASSLRRADAVVVTRADAIDEGLGSWVERHHGRRPLAWTRHVWRSLAVHHRATSIEPVEWLRERRVVSILGVGNREAVRRQLEGSGAVVAADLVARDHQVHDRRTVRRLAELARSASAVLATPKDWVKLRRVIDFGSFPVPVVVPEVSLEPFEGRADLCAAAVEAVQTRAPRP